MKTISKIILTIFVTLCISACNVSDKNTTLYLLNWGDYVSEDVLAKFEKKYNVEIILNDVESNESMYEQIKNNRTSYDIAFPSDYMIEQLDKENLIKDIDYSKIKNYNKDNISKIAQERGPKSNNYIPYFNGTLGIMYNTKNIKNIDKIIKEHGWDVLFDKSLLPKARVGMYNSSRDAFAASLLHNNKSINTTDEKELNTAFNSLKNMQYEMYGDDNLKKNIVTGNLDLSLVYSGDYFEELIVATDEEREITFDYYAPSKNNYWIDGMVIPIHSKNTELAYKFLNFMLDENIALENAQYIGYASPLTNVMELLAQDSDFEFLINNEFYDPAKIKNFDAESFRFLGLDYMIRLEELFIKTKK